MTLLEELAETARNFSVPLSPEALLKAQSYLSFVLEYNAQTNLTADVEPEALYLRHLADGFPAAALLRTRLAGFPRPRVADLGAGAGFIGMAVKLAWPEAEVTLIESLQRKFDFLNMAALKSGLKGLRVVKARAGASVSPGGFDAVVARALAPLPEAVAVATPLLKDGGLFAAYQSEAPDLSSPLLEKALARARARFVDLLTYRLPRETRDRRLAVFQREG